MYYALSIALIRIRLAIRRIAGSVLKCPANQIFVRERMRKHGVFLDREPFVMKHGMLDLEVTVLGAIKSLRS